MLPLFLRGFFWREVGRWGSFFNFFCGRRNRAFYKDLDGSGMRAKDDRSLCRYRDERTSDRISI